MLNVCHIISGDLWAGAEVMAYHLMKGLKKYNPLNLYAILLNEGRLANDLRRLGIIVHVVHENKRSFSSILLDVKKILKYQPADIIHSHRYKENILAYLVSKSLRGVKLIATQHGMPEVQGGEVSLKHRFLSKCNFFVLSKCFDQVVGVSQDIQKAFLKQKGFREDKTRVIHNGIEIPDIQPNRCNRYDSQALVVGSSGRLFPVKDYPFMIEVAKAVLEKSNNISFQLAGDGPERLKLQKLIKDYGLSANFELKGHVDDMPHFYRDLDIYLNTSIHEGIPMSILEAMAHGLPVVAPMVGGLSEIVDDGIQGFLVHERAPEMFAEKCLTLRKDGALRQRMSQRGRQKIIQEFSLQQMAQEYYDLYFDIVNNN